MVWVAVWVLLALGAAGAFFLLGRHLWRKAVALVHEMGDAAERMSDAADRITHRPPEPPGDVRSQSSSSRP